MPSKEFVKIHERLCAVETRRYGASLDWCIEHLDWAWRWRKITEEEKNQLADRILIILDED